MKEEADWPEHRTIISLLLEAFGLTNHTVDDVLWAMGKVKEYISVIEGKAPANVLTKI